MQTLVELSYGKLFKYTMKAINPFKKAIMTTECIVHKFINRQALIILKNDSNILQFNLFSHYMNDLNLGVTWADQDFKSSGHFFSPFKVRGLYGNTNALVLAENYYKFAVSHWHAGDLKRAMFFLGATAHLVQDMTVPQHANIKLLKDHHKFEKFVRNTFHYTPEYTANSNGFSLDSVEEYIRYNALRAIKANKKTRTIKDDEDRFYTLAKYLLPLAQRTTAGLFMLFYQDVSENVQEACN